MKRRIAAILSLLVILTVTFVVIGNEASGREEAMAAAQKQNLSICAPPIINPPCLGLDGTVTVPGITTITLPRTTVRVTLPRVTITRLLPRPTRTITLPPIVRTLLQPRRTVTLPGETITLPGGNATQTVQVPGATATIAGNTVTVRQNVSQGPSGAVTSVTTLAPSQTVSSGQSTVTRGTVVPTPVPTVVEKEKKIQLPGVTRFQALGIGFISLLALIGLILLALWGGYVLGFKNADRQNTNFLRALRESMAIRGKHR